MNNRMNRLLVVSTLFAAACSAAIPPLMPMPRRVAEGEGRIAIDGAFHVEVPGYRDRRLEAAVNRLRARILHQAGMISNPVVGAPVLRIEVTTAAPDYPTLGEDESYTLDVSGSGAVLKAPTVTGAIRGFATFAQLVTPGANGYEVRGIHIEDRPRFPWRGLMLDVSRHWMPVEVVERNLDAMEAVKLNVFHWHLSDDQGFRVESRI